MSQLMAVRVSVNQPRFRGVGVESTRSDATLAFAMQAAEQPIAFDVAKEFEALAERWRTDTAFSSSTTKMFAHPAYRQVVALGMRVVPIILASLAARPEHWLRALNEITGENPVPARYAGDLAQSARAWVEWGRQRGLIP